MTLSPLIGRALAPPVVALFGRSAHAVRTIPYRDIEGRRCTEQLS